MSARKGIICYRIFSRAYFHLPFLALYFYECGYGIVQISILMAVYGGASFFFGLLRKRYFFKLNDKKDLITSEIVKIIGLLFLACSHRVIGIVIGQIFLGLSFAIPSGADSRILYEHIDEVGFQERSSGYMFLSLLISGIIGSVMLKYNPRYPFYGSILAALVTIATCTILLPSDKPKQDNSQKDTILSIRIKELNHIDIRVILTYSLTRGIVLSFFSCILPFYMGTELNLDIYSFALVLAGYTMSGNLAAKVLGIFPDSKKKYHLGVYYMTVTVFLAFLLIGIRSVMIVALATTMLGSVAGISRPLYMMEVKINGNLSIMAGIMETAYSAVNIIVLLISGILYKIHGLTAVLIFVLGLWILYNLMFTIIQKHSF